MSAASQNNKINLQVVDSAEITIVMDNHVDLLLGDTGPVKRPGRQKTMQLDTLYAEHGLSLWLTTRAKGVEHHVLLDTGFSPGGVLHNLDYLELDPARLEGLVLSHGHLDHTGCLKGLLERRQARLPLAAHPDAFCNRARRMPDGSVLPFPPALQADELAQLGADLLPANGPLLMARDTLLITGPVPRLTEFEQGMPGSLIQDNGDWRPDDIIDDLAIIIDLGSRGLVLISGCAHSGIVNTLQYATQLTGRKDFAAVLGGFHLSGELMAPAVEPTIKGLLDYSPNLIMPLHCTGWSSAQAIARAFGDSFALSSVGSKIIFD